MKSKEEVVAQFNEEVNMTAEELEAWLEDPKSATAGTGVGVESGHKIVEILKKNPTKDPEKYDEEDLEHMRKVVGYNKRHLAQEDHLKETKTREELEHVKSTISLKNWGHDPLKTLDEEHGNAPSTDSVSNGHGGHDETSQAQDDAEENPTEEESEVEGKEEGGEGEDKPKEAKKRKLESDELEPDVDEEAGAEREAPLSGADELEEGQSGEVSESVEGQNEQDEPPRKKAKSDAA